VDNVDNVDRVDRRTLIVLLTLLLTSYYIDTDTIIDIDTDTDSDIECLFIYPLSLELRIPLYDIVLYYIIPEVDTIQSVTAHKIEVVLLRSVSITDTSVLPLSDYAHMHLL
jgi:hypothetical protein